MVRYARNVIEEFRRAKHYKYNLSVCPVWAYFHLSLDGGKLGKGRRRRRVGRKGLDTEGRRSPVRAHGKTDGLTAVSALPTVQGTVLTRPQWLGVPRGGSDPCGSHKC